MIRRRRRRDSYRRRRRTGSSFRQRSTSAAAHRTHDEVRRVRFVVLQGVVRALTAWTGDPGVTEIGEGVFFQA